jgi:NAD(P)-dependent dehydrogenase (short-subunit alcohol dehydrogenase family)
MNKAVVITGAAGNLGLATARHLSAQGWRVAALDLRTETLAVAYAGQPQVFTQAADLMQPDSTRAACDAAARHFGRLDALVNIAGGFTMGPLLHETPDSDWDFMLNLNARTTFNACRAAVPHLLAAGTGGIVNIGARAARPGQARMGPYSVAKSAVITLTEVLAAELREQNVNVNCLLPGILDTPQNRRDMPEADFSRWVRPEAVAEVIAFLLSPAARPISSAAIPVYGRS